MSDFLSKKWVMWLFLFIFMPLGLFLLWMHHDDFKVSTKAVVSLFFLFGSIIFLTLFSVAILHTTVANSHSNNVTENVIPESDSHGDNDTSVSKDTSNTEKIIENDITITISAAFAEGTTQAELDASVEKNTYKSATLTETGEIVYVMSQSQHVEFLAVASQSIKDGVAELIGSETAPTITDIVYNDIFTEFTITTTSTELSITEMILVTLFYTYGGMYANFRGEPISNISVTYVTPSGDVINTANSGDLSE